MIQFIKEMYQAVKAYYAKIQAKTYWISLKIVEGNLIIRTCPIPVIRGVFTPRFQLELNI